MNKISNKKFDKERDLYGVRNIELINCTFAGPADGESALKETNQLYIQNCDFQLRYPLWHANDVLLENSRMSEDCRAALWYDKNLHIKSSQLGGIKAVRECKNVMIEDCTIESKEFGWMTKKIQLNNTKLISEYPFLKAKKLKFNNFSLNGKYSFQYVKDVEISNSSFDTKDAFWHAKNVTISDSVVKGEYLAWYAEDIKFVRCKIMGTQPFCYTKNLVLENCEMIDCDLAFENTTVIATIKNSIDSVKNPKGGSIIAESIGEIILDEHCINRGACSIIETSKQK